MSDVCGDFTYEDVYLRSWDLAKGILGILGQVRDLIIIKKSHNNKIISRVALANVWPSCVHLG